MRALLALLLLVLAPLATQAHPLAPALLDVHETAPGRYDVLWRTSVLRAAGVDVAPRFPEGCTSGAASPVEVVEGSAVVTRWSLDCGASGLAGRTVTIDGLRRSGINALVRVAHADAPVAEALLDAGAPAFTVPQGGAGGAVFVPYLRLGVEHLLTGVDHLLFVTGLVLLVRRPRAVAIAVTGFTLGHSVTLALAVLGLVHFDARLTEVGIALTLLVLACEIARPRGEGPSALGRHPLAMACAFGLVHGLGFAGALSAIGLPPGAIGSALLAFNLGIELAQLAVVAAWLALAAVVARVSPVTSRPGLRALPAYSIGTLAAYFVLQRAAEVVGVT
ncbi:MAG TPA: HupE/UreJ family protein [Nevskiaceae bacterium]|nr:HupE/UreJ family protein [Nevskiaceae bacterium]